MNLFQIFQKYNRIEFYTDLVASRGHVSMRITQYPDFIENQYYRHVFICEKGWRCGTGRTPEMAHAETDKQKFRGTENLDEELEKFFA